MLVSAGKSQSPGLSKDSSSKTSECPQAFIGQIYAHIKGLRYVCCPTAPNKTYRNIYPYSHSSHSNGQSALKSQSEDNAGWHLKETGPCCILWMRTTGFTNMAAWVKHTAYLGNNLTSLYSTQDRILSAYFFMCACACMHMHTCDNSVFMFHRTSWDFSFPKHQMCWKLSRDSQKQKLSSILICCDSLLFDSILGLIPKRQVIKCQQIFVIT